MRGLSGSVSGKKSVRESQYEHDPAREAAKGGAPLEKHPAADP